MLQIIVPATELWDERNEVFINTEEQTIQLEHSLVSLSKWESKWCKSFFSKKEKTKEETIDYIKCMSLTDNIPSSVYYCLSDKNLEEIGKYIEAPMTATTFSNNQNVNKKIGGDVITSELIYYWMISHNIPVEFETWHINRLLTLIRICEIKNQPPKKMSKSAIMSRNAALNAARKKKYNTNG